MCSLCSLRGLLLLALAGPREPLGDPQSQERTDHRRITSDTKRDEYKINMNRVDLAITTNLPACPRPPSLPAEKVIINPLASGGSTLRVRPAERVEAADSVARYDIASLQLFTNSFSQENLIGEGMLGSVYKGELPKGKVRHLCFFNFL